MEKEKRLVLVGGGGHCKSVLDAALRMQIFDEIVITDDGFHAGKTVLGCRVVGNDERLPDLYGDGFRYAFIAIGSMKDTILRQRTYKRISDAGFEIPNIIDPSSIVSGTVRLGKGIFVGKNAVINADAWVDDLAIINTGSIVEHDCRVGRLCHIAVGAVICGGCSLGESVFVGANATIIQGVKIGMNSIIGAGSVVLKDVPINNTIVGVRGEALQRRSNGSLTG